MTSIFVALLIYAPLLLAIQAARGGELPFWVSTLIYLAIYVVINGFLAQRRASSGERVERPTVPISGPLAGRPSATIMARFTVSSLLSSLNPLQLLQQLAQLGGQLVVMVRQLGRYPDAASSRSKARYRLPLEGAWFTMNGGITPATSHSWDLVTQRYAYDFVKVDEHFRRHSGEGTEAGEYFCWDQPIVAAADGVVVRVRDGVRTAPWLGQYVIDFLGPDFRGNFVVIKHAEKEFGFYAHLIRGKMAVKVGDKVIAGEELGRCGHSGHSTEPHLHFHLQDHPNFFVGMGLPVKFHNVRVDGELQASGYLRGGQRVEQT